MSMFHKIFKTHIKTSNQIFKHEAQMYESIQQSQLNQSELIIGSIVWVFGAVQDKFPSSPLYTL